MTITADRPATSPRTLITPELFDRLTKRIKLDHPTHADLAEQIMEQALAFLAACAARSTARLAPSERRLVVQEVRRQFSHAASPSGCRNVNARTCSRTLQARGTLSEAGDQRETGRAWIWT